MHGKKSALLVRRAGPAGRTAFGGVLTDARRNLVFLGALQEHVEQNNELQP
jgi:hypothetical protein